MISVEQLLGRDRLSVIGGDVEPVTVGDAGTLTTLRLLDTKSGEVFEVVARSFYDVPYLEIRRKRG